MHRWIVVWVAVALAFGAVGCGDDASQKAQDAGATAKAKAQEAAKTAQAKAQEAAKTAQAKAQEAAKTAEAKARKAAESAKSKVPGAVPAGPRVEVAMSDFKFSPSKLDADAGQLTVTAKNDGKQEHEFVLLRTDKAPDAIPVKNGRASEADSVGEISEKQPGQSGSHTFTLKPGNYVFICNVKGHYAAGMRGSLSVK